MARHTITRNAYVLVISFLLANSNVQAADPPGTIPISDEPLTVSVSSSADPNVMLLIDDSLSMDSIVWSDGYIQAITPPVDDSNWQPPTFGDWDQGNPEWNDRAKDESKPKNVILQTGNVKTAELVGTYIDNSKDPAMTIEKTLILPVPVN
ncbi:MAG: hypothetical protein PVF82_12995, partial [Gammaproteobacteria bacterium]